MKKTKKCDDSPGCRTCAACCRYVALQIDKPKRKWDYDHIRWYLLHKNVSVFIDHDKDWFVEFQTECDALQPNNLCGNYKSRPRICRDHGDNEQFCEMRGNTDPHKILFTTAAEYEKYLDKKKIKWRWKKK